ncbi:unnamed protein product [Owenia fusiformis]|uniref:Uncharacterized protein n=1 Tax=Owenia fusiformis TaxID=6347 RepID=A0A8J1TBQ1_OWEFU|nr:unnamed protein product [Owenia fusiformis]
MSLQCYNRTCGQKYDESNNSDDACKFHPGTPVFHDALKGWSCCKRRSTDFTEFLNIPGCTKGPHSNIKPPEPEKPEQNGTDIEKIIQEQAPPPPRAPIAEPTVRPPSDEPLIRLPATVAGSLKSALERKLNQLKIQNDQTEEADDGTVKPGTTCKNNACSCQYINEDSDIEICRYHPGVPIFHEGMKYWSCCRRKTSDFNTFMSQEGCTSGKHLWKKNEADGEKQAVCRFDWFQTGNFITISIYSKVAVPEKSYVEVNKVTANINIVFEGGESHFQHFLVLNGIIDPAACNVKMLGTKVEVNLRKAEPGSWPNLELPPPKQQQEETSKDIDTQDVDS